jgi:hypothetical protein
VRHQLQRGAEGSSAPVFAFVEGALVTALRQGTWILLDEVNLAPTETLERLAGVLEVRSQRERGSGHSASFRTRCTLLSVAARHYYLAAAFSVPCWADGAHRAK